MASHAEQMQLAQSMRPPGPEVNKVSDFNRNLELPATAYLLRLDQPDEYHIYWEKIIKGDQSADIRRLDPAFDAEHPDQYIPMRELPRRPGFNTHSLGAKTTIFLNQFKLTAWPSEDHQIVQYDLRVAPRFDMDTSFDVARQQGLARVLWNSNPMKHYRTIRYRGIPEQSWIFDGKSIAWNRCYQPRNTQNGLFEDIIVVDLDVEHGEQSQGKNIWSIIFRQTKVLQMQAIKAYLSGEMRHFDNAILEGINFLDHVLRQWPSEKYTCIKRSFYDFGEVDNKQNPYKAERLDANLDFLRGCYASVRLCHKGLEGLGSGLAVNVDVSNGLFWAPQRLLDVILNFCYRFGCPPGKVWDAVTLGMVMRPVFNNDTQKWMNSEHHCELRRFYALRFRPKHRGEIARHGKKHAMAIKTFTGKQGPNNSQLGDAKSTFFEWFNPATGLKTKISVFDYTLQKYNHGIQFWHLPLVESRHEGHFALEHCWVEPKQRYNFKTNPDQTALMIKKAVQRPNERFGHVKKGVDMLNWQQDPYLKHFGIQIDPNMTASKAILMAPPFLRFGDKIVKPGYTGRWSIQHTKFYKLPEHRDLQSWGICVLNHCVKPEVIIQFSKTLSQTYKTHGGHIPNAPHITWHTEQEGNDLGELVHRTYMETGNHFQQAPSILLFVLPRTDSEMYHRLKKSMDCKLGVVSQMLRKEQVEKGSPAYCSNVLMKFNAKLGGITNIVAPQSPFGGNPAWWQQPTMIIGADISHPPQHGPQASMAAMTMSNEVTGTRYWASCATNGQREEIMREATIYHMMNELFKRWVETVSKGRMPAEIYYFRDGVSEGQYFHVIDQEVNKMKLWITKTYQLNEPVPFTVVICSKRHKIRFLPKVGSSARDINANPVPGVLVERDVTHPFEYDFYLNSHSAIQGTARPTHYHVVLNEANCDTAKLQYMMYHQCYQYIRSATSVSIHPAVYYAHLAASRSRAHEWLPYGETVPRFGQKFVEQEQMRRYMASFYGPLNFFEKTQAVKNNDMQNENIAPFETELVPLGAQLNRSGRDRIAMSMWYI